MTNLIYQGKINRQFWGKLIRQSTSIYSKKYGDLCQESGHILEGVFINLDCFQTELEIKS